MTEKIEKNVVPKGTVNSEQNVNKKNREMAKGMFLLLLFLGLAMLFYISCITLMITQVDAFWILLTIICGSIGLAFLFEKTVRTIDEIKEHLNKQKKKEGRPEAQAYEDGPNIQVNITDENSSVLLTFSSEEDYTEFCKEVANLERLP